MTLLAMDLKEGTKSVHREAERSKFVRAFFRGEVSPTLYGRFLVSLYHVYSALEDAMERNMDNKNIQRVYFPEELFRKQALERDLEFYNGAEWRTMLSSISPAQQAYIDAIRNCTTKDTTTNARRRRQPELLLAHAYVRYLGDLSGGQILARRLQKFNNLPSDSEQGVAFYMFDKIEDPEQFKNLFRQRLNEMDIDEETHQEIVQEACNAFVRNINLFQEFDDDIEEKSLTLKPSVPQPPLQQRPHHDHHVHFKFDPNVRPPPQCVVHMTWEIEFEKYQQEQRQHQQQQQPTKLVVGHTDDSWGVGLALASVAVGGLKVLVDLASWMARLQKLRCLAVAAGFKSFA